jgi:hypothetical protein
MTSDAYSTELDPDLTIQCIQGPIVTFGCCESVIGKLRSPGTLDAPWRHQYTGDNASGQVPTKVAFKFIPSVQFILQGPLA